MDATTRRRWTGWGTALALVSLAVFGGLTMIGTTVAGATVKCGTISSETWTAAGNPYLVTCDLTIASSAMLTIEPGVQVRVDPGYAITVDGGYLLAAGTANATVTFDSNATKPARGDWVGIVGKGYGYIQLTFTSVRHAQTGLRTDATAPPGGGPPYVNVVDSEFADHRDWAMDFGFWGNGTTGQGAYLTRVHVHDNGAGIRSTGLTLQESVIERNDAVGLHATQDTRGGLRMNRTVVADNGDTGVVLTGTGSASAPSSLVCNDIERNGLLSPNPNATAGLDIRSMNADVGLASVYLNNFVDNVVQALDSGRSAFDNGAFGNFWSDYTGSDDDGDGIGETPYMIDFDSIDRFPLVSRIVDCKTPPPPPVDRVPRPGVPLGAELTGSVDDVTLRWSLSPDDGAGENDVVGYAIFESSTFDTGGAGYVLLVALPAGTSQYVHVGAGVDGQDHFYRLVVADAAGQEAASAQQFGKTTRLLSAGSHLLSVPLLQTDTGVATVFQTVDFDRVRTYVNPSGYGKNWKVFHKQKPWGTMTDIDETRAYWVVVNADSDFVIAGLVPVSTTIRLETGWNLVGYPSFVDRTVGDALAGANYQTVEGFDPGRTPYQLRRLGAGDVMSAGDGFWIHVSSPFDWRLDN